MNVINSSILMKSEPSDEASIETECLFGEFVTVLDQCNDWLFCKLATDNYCGWIKKNNLGYLRKPTHRVLAIRTCIFKDRNVKSTFIHYLSIGSLLYVKEIDENWAEIYLPGIDTSKTAFVPSMHIVDLKDIVNDWVSISEQFVGTPYKWGGRDSIAIDCSALLQLSYQTHGENIPRNTLQQIKLKKTPIENINNLRRGCVIFWNGHVGIMVDKVNCIHANAFHMKTITEPLLDVINRTDNDNQILKMMDFN